MMNEITLDGIQYLTLQALFKAASNDKQRPVLNRIFYDQPNDRFVATDGHMLRVERIDRNCEPPEKSFLLSRAKLMLNRAQLRMEYGKAKFADEPLGDIFITIEYEEYGADQDMIYPNYSNVIPSVELSKPIPFIGFNPHLLAKISRTFYQSPHALQFRFFGDLKTVMLFKGGGDENSPQFAGIVMPVRLMWEKSHTEEVAA